MYNIIRGYAVLYRRDFLSYIVFISHLLCSSGQKFSKRQINGDSLGCVQSLRREGHLPSALLTWLAATGGLFDFAPHSGGQSGEFPGLWRPERRVDEMLKSV